MPRAPREDAKTRRNQTAQKPLTTKEPAKRPVSRPQRFQRLKRAQAKGFVSPTFRAPPYPPSNPFTIALALAKSICPGWAALRALTTLPMSLTLAAPVEAMAALAAAVTAA